MNKHETANFGQGTNAGANFIQSRHFMSKIVVEKSQKL
jgi:hypothetical protein